MKNLRTRISQFLIDFAEDRKITCQKIGEYRARRYGDLSWQWRWTFKQECIWGYLEEWSFVYI